MKTKLLLLLLLLSLPVWGEVEVRYVSLLAEPVTITLDGQSHLLSPLTPTRAFHTRAGVGELTLRAGGERLYSRSLGLADSHHYTLVVFGSPDAPRPEGFWTALKQMFEGEGRSHSLGYAVQVSVLRDQAFIESDRSYLRVFHGATGVVPVKLVEKGEVKTTVNYAQESDLLSFSAGRHTFDVEARDGHLMLLESEIQLEPGRVTTLYLTRDESEPQTLLQTVSHFSPPSEP